jgi:predicted acyltransferase (DUF342 family)
MLNNWLDASSSSNRYQQMYIKGFLDISGGNLILRNNDLHILKGNSYLNRNLIVNNDTSMNGNLVIGKDLHLNGRFYANYADNSIPTNAIVGGIPLATGIFETDIQANQRLFVQKDASFNANIYVNNAALFNSDVSINNRLFVNGSIHATKIYDSGSLLTNKYATINSPTFTGTVSGITKGMVGLSNVDNTTDLDKPISTATQNVLSQFINSNSPTLTGIPIAPTAPNTTNTNQIATTSYVVTGLSGLLGTAPAKLSTLSQIASAINNDPSYNITITSRFAPLTSPYFITNITTPKLFATGDVSLNSRVFINGDASLNGNLSVGKTISEGGRSLITKYATLANPTFTGLVNLPRTTISQQLDVTGDASLNSNVYIGKDLTVNGNLVVKTYTSQQTVTSVNYQFIVAEDMSLNGRLFITKDISLNNGLFVGGDVSLNKNVFVKGNLVSVTPDSSDNSNLVATTAFVNNQLTLLKVDPVFTGNMYADNLNVNYDALIQGNLLVNNKIVLNNDVSMNNNLDLSGSIIAHSNMNLYGIINQYTTTLDQGYIVNYSNLTPSGDISANGIKLSNSNTFVGIDAGKSNTNGINNTLVGYNAGSNIITGSNNINIGMNAQSSTTNVSDEITLGNNSNTVFRCNIPTITSLSDIRDKTNIEKLPLGLDFIADLRPVEFDWNTRDGSRIQNKDYGFIAQELQKSQEDFGITVPNLIYDKNPDKLEASYGVLLPIIVNAIKELKELTVKQQVEIEELKQKLSA